MIIVHRQHARNERERILTYERVPTEFLTEDKKNILVDSFAVWRIDGEHAYLAKLRSRDIAEVFLLEIITTALGEITGNHPLSDFINPDPSKIRLEEINRTLAESCRKSAMKGYGIEIIDARINMSIFPDQNR